MATGLQITPGQFYPLEQWLEVAHQNDGTLQPLNDGDISDSANLSTLKLALPGDSTQVLLGDGTFGAPPGSPVTNVTTVTGAYTLRFADGNGVVVVNTAGATTVSVPDDSLLPLAVGVSIEVWQAGVGQTSVGPAGTGGVTVNGLNGHVAIAGRYGHAVLRKIAANAWFVSGDLSAGGIIVPPPPPPTSNYLPLLAGTNNP